MVIITIAVQESSNTETQVQFGTEDDVQVQNSDVVTDQSATTNGDDNTVSQSSTNDTTQSQILLEMLLKLKTLIAQQLNLLYQLVITIVNLNLQALQLFKANLLTN